MKLNNKKQLETDPSLVGSCCRMSAVNLCKLYIWSCVVETTAKLKVDIKKCNLLHYSGLQ